MDLHVANNRLLLVFGFSFVLAVSKKHKRDRGQGLGRWQLHDLNRVEDNHSKSIRRGGSTLYESLSAQFVQS